MSAAAVLLAGCGGGDHAHRARPGAVPPPVAVQVRGALRGALHPAPTTVPAASQLPAQPPKLPYVTVERCRGPRPEDRARTSARPARDQPRRTDRLGRPRLWRRLLLPGTLRARVPGVHRAHADPVRRSPAAIPARTSPAARWTARRCRRIDFLQERDLTEH